MYPFKAHDSSQGELFSPLPLHTLTVRNFLSSFSTPGAIHLAHPLTSVYTAVYAAPCRSPSCSGHRTLKWLSFSLGLLRDDTLVSTETTSAGSIVKSAHQHTAWHRTCINKGSNLPIICLLPPTHIFTCIGYLLRSNKLPKSSGLKQSPFILLIIL